MEKYDFSGWATRNDLVCSDGRTIRKDAFKHGLKERALFKRLRTHRNAGKIGYFTSEKTAAAGCFQEFFQTSPAAF